MKKKREFGDKEIVEVEKMIEALALKTKTGHFGMMLIAEAIIESRKLVKAVEIISKIK